jgi:hypothetical protein
LVETSGPVNCALAGDIVTVALAMTVPAGALSGIFAATTARVTLAAIVPSAGAPPLSQAVAGAQRTQ